MQTCNACGHPTRPEHLWPNSNWCHTCVQTELDHQNQQTDHQPKQTFTR